MFIPNSILMAWINFCESTSARQLSRAAKLAVTVFSGFILIKLPFPLTPRFKQLLQANVNTTDMDVTWVSSLSWYFLNLFGLNTIYRLILGGENGSHIWHSLFSRTPSSR